MSEGAMSDIVVDPAARTSDAARALRRKRYAADARLRLYGIAAIAAAIGLLGILIATLIIGGYQAFVQTHIRIDFPISAGTSIPPIRPRGTTATSCATRCWPFFRRSKTHGTYGRSASC